MIFVALTFVLMSLPAFANTFGTGGKKGEFYPTGQKICGQAAEAFLSCEAVTSGGSTDNVARVKSGEFGLGLAMLPVAQDSGLKFAELQIGEGSFITANPTATSRVMKLVGNMEAAVFPGALKLAAKGRVTFVTIGEGSGETGIMRKQLAEAGASESALKVVADQDAFISALQGQDNAFGFFTRIPKPDNALFVAIKDNNMQLLGAYNPAFKNPATKVTTVEIAGFSVKTPVTPVVVVYNSDSEDITEIVKIAKGIEIDTLIPKEKTGVWAKLRKFATSMKEMSGEKIQELSTVVSEKVAEMNL